MSVNAGLRGSPPGVHQPTAGVRLTRCGSAATDNRPRHPLPHAGARRTCPAGFASSRVHTVQRLNACPYDVTAPVPMVHLRVAHWCPSHRKRVHKKRAGHLVQSYQPNIRSVPCPIRHSAATHGHIPSTTPLHTISSQTYMLTHCNRHRSRRCIPNHLHPREFIPAGNSHATRAAHHPAPALRGVRAPAGYARATPLLTLPEPSPPPPTALE